MKAAVVRAHGGPETLVFEKDFPDPRPGEGDVIVAVKASSLNYHDVFTRRGMPGIKVPMPAIMGLDVAGEIAEVGPGVTGWKNAGKTTLTEKLLLYGGAIQLAGAVKAKKAGADPKNIKASWEETQQTKREPQA